VSELADDLILIVDDEEFIRRLIALQLEAGGYRSVSAASAAEARAVLSEQPCSLVLCDLNMPRESGLDLLASVLPEYPDLAALMITGVDDTHAAEAAARLGAYGYMVKPFSQKQLLINVANALRRRELEVENRDHRERLETLVDERTRALRESVLRLGELANELRRSREETIRRLSRAGEYRDEETGAHVVRVGRVSEKLARSVGLPDDECAMIGIVSPLHDIGKVGIPDAILRKPGPLDPEERAVTNRHAEIGHRILTGSDSPLLELAATIALTHHERYDGNGYPRGLGGADIPIAGRITAVADVYDALTHDRPYRSRFAGDEAAAMIRTGRGSQFDPVVVDAFVESLDEFASITAMAV
jgi:putative two-component system response regulator